MIRKLLATTAVTALIASGAYAQTTGAQTEQPRQQTQQNQVATPHEITVSHGDTIIIEAERAEVELNLRVGAGPAGVRQQTPEQTAQADGQRADHHAAIRDRSELQAGDMQQFSADDFLGSEVYSANDENIGTVNDILLTQDGEIDAVIVDVGGFLGMGAREVALGMEDLEVMGDGEGNWYVYTPYTQQQLEGSPEYDQASWAEQRDQQRLTGEMAQQMPAAQQDQQAGQQQPAGAAGEHVIADGGTIFVQSDSENFQLNFQVRLAGQDAAQIGEAQRQETAQTGAQVNEDAQAAAPAERDAQTTAAIDRDQMTAVEMGQIRADDLIGSTLYGANEANIGTVGDVLLSEDGQVNAVLIDVGGFLGIGSREVALSLNEVEFMRDQGNNWFIYTQYTQEQLEAAPEYDEATYTGQ